MNLFCRFFFKGVTSEQTFYLIYFVVSEIIMSRLRVNGKIRPLVTRDKRHRSITRFFFHGYYILKLEENIKLPVDFATHATDTRTMPQSCIRRQDCYIIAAMFPSRAHRRVRRTSSLMKSLQWPWVNKHTPYCLVRYFTLQLWHGSRPALRCYETHA